MPQTAQQLKAEIDRGKTGDKVADGFDPGLSTLGTDDEAAGAPNTPEQVAMAQRLEIKGAPPPKPGQAAETSRPGMPALWPIIGALVLVALIVALVVWSR